MRFAPRIPLGSIKDDYVLGVLCRKAGLIQYAKKTLPNLFANSTRRQVFSGGVDDASDYSYSDIAKELWFLRQGSTEVFDWTVSRAVGDYGFRCIIRAIDGYNPGDKPRVDERESIRDMMQLLNRLSESGGVRRSHVEDSDD